MGAYLLGVDIGTSACKVALFDENGTVRAARTGAYAVRYPHPGWAEQDPEEWWCAACETIRSTLDESGVKPAQIAGIGVDGQSWSAIAVDRYGAVLSPTPIWTDTRSQAVCDALKRRISGDEWFSVCGNPLQPSYTLPKVCWYRQNTPAVYDAAAFILQSNGYIVYRLTGAVTQDLSQGYGYGCFNMRKGCWDRAMARRIGIRESLLPPLFACHEVVGAVTREAALLTGLCEGTPVVAGGLDAACGTLGAGVIAAGQAQEQGGQAGGMSLCIDRYAADERLILSFHVVPGRWLLQGGTTGGGGALKWLRETVCPELSFEQMSTLAETIAPGSDGVTFLPYLAGERSPIWNPDASGVFFGLNYTVTRAHLIRAVMESIAYALRHNLETAANAGAEAAVLRTTGGSANSRVWTQMKADVTGKDIDVPASDTATTLGAALLAGVGTRVYADFASAVAKTVAVRRSHRANPDRREVYEKGYRRYRELYDRLRPMMIRSDKA